MTLTSQSHILASKKPAALRRYMERVSVVQIPEGVHIPEDPKEAMLLGLRLSRQQGYEDGLVDGMRLGLDIIFEMTAH